MQLSNDQKFEALKLRYQDQVELLRYMTKLDLELFGGYMTLQLALGGWFAQHHPSTVWAGVGIAIIDFTLAVIATALLRNNYRRRKEIVGTVKNINAALRYDKSGAYLDEGPINAPTQFHPWGPWYIGGVVAAFIGILMVLFGRM